MDFATAFDKLIAHEGGYTNDPRDPGNWTGGKPGVGELRGTKFGIAANTYPHLDIAGLTVDQARVIYRRDWWDRLQLDELPPPARFPVFDAAVNSGPGSAARWLQRAVGVAEDGRIGPRTLAAARALDPEALAARVTGHRLLHMTQLSTWPTFGRGWARRLAANLVET